MRFLKLLWSEKFSLIKWHLDKDLREVGKKVKWIVMKKALRKRWQIQRPCGSSRAWLRKSKDASLAIAVGVTMRAAGNKVGEITKLGSRIPLGPSRWLQRFFHFTLREMESYYQSYGFYQSHLLICFTFVKNDLNEIIRWKDKHRNQLGNYCNNLDYGAMYKGGSDADRQK